MLREFLSNIIFFAFRMEDQELLILFLHGPFAFLHLATSFQFIVKYSDYDIQKNVKMFFKIDLFYFSWFF